MTAECFANDVEAAGKSGVTEGLVLLARVGGANGGD
jgi:hypothetical protein